MNEQIDAKTQILIPPDQSIIEPIGVRILGEVDPRTLSEEEFKKSADLLFHGAARAFEFFPNFDYHSEGYLRESDGSTTLGFGFYTVDTQQEAANYSVVRQHNSEATPFVIEILPYQARVLDLRRKDDPSKNAPVPRELAEKWRKYYLEYYRNKKPREGNIGALFDSSEAEYLAYLNRVMQLKEIDLRVLLESAPCREAGSRNLPSPLWAQLFSDFMLTEGYDGVVYNEGGEGKSKGGATYVFYNLEKIGTFESWHKRKK